MKIVGVHFWDKKVHLCWSDGGSVSTASFNLPADLRRDDILEQEFALAGVFKAITQYLGEKVGITEFGMVVCVPDEFGVNDIKRVYEVGKQSNIVIVRTVNETLALALALYAEYDFDGRLLAAVVNENRVGISEYDFSDEGVEKIATYMAGPWAGSSFARAPFIYNHSSKLFEATEAEIIFSAGGMNSSISLEQGLKSYIKSSAFVNQNIEFKMVGAEGIVDGLGLLCGKIEGQEAVAGLGVKDTFSPYEMCVSINGELYTVMNPEASLTQNAGTEVKKLPESGRDFEEFTVYEKRKTSYINLGTAKVSRESLDSYYRKPVFVGLNINDKREISLLIQDMATDKYIEMPIGAAGGAAGSGDDEGDVSGFIEKILPIIDNLEYASKFAQDPDNPYTKGILQSYENAVKILEENGIKIISGEGEPFDFNLQNAVAHVTDVDLPENTVKQVMQTGYVYKGKVLRTASVIVAN